MPVTPLAGTLDVVVSLPGSKSITNRALVCAALADGTSTLTNALHADDTEAMVEGLQASKSSVSVALKDLTRLYLVERFALPGDRRHAVRQEGLRYGIPVSAALKKNLDALAGQLKIAPLAP